MSELKHLTLVHLAPEENDKREMANFMRKRFEIIVKLTHCLKINTFIIEASSLMNSNFDVELTKRKLKKTDAIWWFGHLVFLGEMKLVWKSLCGVLNEESLKLKLFEEPIVVEETLNLSLHYDKLKEAGIPQAKTIFVPLSKEMLLEGKEIRTFLEEKFKEIEVKENGVFFRTCYGTLKTYSRLSKAYSKNELLEGSLELIQQLKKHQEIGGLAVREMLRISNYQDDLEYGRLRREYRVFVGWGEPWMWFWNIPYLKEMKKRLERGDFDDAKLHKKQLDEIEALSSRIGKLLKSKLLVADFGVLEDGEIVLIEINPGHCAYWLHESAFIGVYGRFMAKMLGMENYNSFDLVKELSIEFEGRDILFGCF